MRLRRQAMRGDAGFTLVELAVAMALFGIILSISFFGWRTWATSLDEKGTARDVTSALRNAQQRAVSQGTTFCVHFDVTGNTYTVYQYSCGSGSVKAAGPLKPQGSSTIASPSFTLSNGTSGPDAYFFARGSATTGSVLVKRPGSSTQYTINVEGLTGRASISSP